MTEVDFYTHVQDKYEVACTLSAKAVEKGLRVLIYTPDSASAERMDQLLWTWQQLSFVPHCRGGSRLAPVTPVIVDHEAESLDRDDVLINLHPETPSFFSRFHRLVEIVGQDEGDKRQARERYKFYRDRGYDIRTHDLSSHQKGRR